MMEEGCPRYKERFSKRDIGDSWRELTSYSIEEMNVGNGRR